MRSDVIGPCVASVPACAGNCRDVGERVKLQTHRVGVSCDSLIERHVEGGDVLSENESEEEIEVKKKGARGAKYNTPQTPAASVREHAEWDESLEISAELPPMWTTTNRTRYDRNHVRYPSDLTNEEWALTRRRSAVVTSDGECARDCVRSRRERTAVALSLASMEEAAIPARRIFSAGALKDIVLAKSDAAAQGCGWALLWSVSVIDEAALERTGRPWHVHPLPDAATVLR
jgi:hypothetical protein